MRVHEIIEHQDSIVGAIKKYTRDTVLSVDEIRLGEWELCDKIRSLKNTLPSDEPREDSGISFRIRSHHMHYSEAVRDLSKV